jgi:hypothetical protein
MRYIAEQEVGSILENKKVMLSLAIISAIDALKNDPNTKMLLGCSKEETSFPLIDDYYYNSLLSDPRILQMTDQLYEKISNLCVQSTMIRAPLK